MKKWNVLAKVEKRERAGRSAGGSQVEGSAKVDGTHNIDIVKVNWTATDSQHLTRKQMPDVQFEKSLKTAQD